MTRSRIAIGGGVLAIIAAAGVWVSTSGCNVDKQVTEPHRERSLVTEEIRTMLLSADFKQRLQASRQIDKLAPDEQLSVLLDLARDRDPAARLLAARKLQDIDEPRAREALRRLMKDDPDIEVRETAGGTR